MTVCKEYDETTAEDFRSLFVARFPDGDSAILDTFLANPARKSHPSSGAIAYDEAGSVQAILGLIPRIVYCGQKPLRAANGVAISVRKDADRSFFSDFIREAIRSDGADLYFVNTAIVPSRKRTALALEGLADGPASCGEIRERQLRSNGFFARALRKAGMMICGRAAGSSNPPYQACCDRARSTNPPYQACCDRARSMIAPDSLSGNTLVLCNEKAISDTDFNSFWESYLKANEGLVSSRTAEELRWVFGKGLASGDVVLITARKDDALRGYAFCRRTDETATCWRVVDLIALGNDEKILESLIAGASQILRKYTPALYLQIAGYPTWVQPLLKRLFPKSVSFGFNKCIWVALNEKTKALLGDWVNAPNGWYGCPYDGDMCLM